MKQSIVVFMVFALVSGCATAKKTYVADGREGYSINCSGSALNWGMCAEKAGQICGAAGYDVLEKVGDQGTFVSANQNSLYGGSIMNRSMLIACK